MLSYLQCIILSGGLQIGVNFSGSLITVELDFIRTNSYIHSSLDRSYFGNAWGTCYIHVWGRLAMFTPPMSFDDLRTINVVIPKDNQHGSYPLPHSLLTVLWACAPYILFRAEPLGHVP